MRRARDHPHETVEILCTKCERHGRYSKAHFCELVGGDCQVLDGVRLTG